MHTEYIDTFNKDMYHCRFSEAEIEAFLIKMEPKQLKFSKGDYIVKEGEPIEECYMITKGSALQVRVSPSGEKSIFQIVQSAHTIGFGIIMLPHRDYWASDYIAKGECEVLAFSKDKLIESMKNPDIFTNKIFFCFATNLSFYLEKNMISLRSLKHTTVRERITSYLYEMYLLHGKKQITLELNRSEFASYMNIPQPSLSRELSKMKKDGLIDFHKSTIKILNLEALKKSY